MEDKINRKVRDSMFRYMYSFDEYRRDLVVGLLSSKYATSVIEPVTLESVFATDIQNDLGLLVDDSFLLLSEAQSTVPANIAVRMLEYLSRTTENYVNSRREFNVYSTTKIALPTPRLFAVYTGDAGVPSLYRLSEHFQSKGDVELQVHILTETTPGIPKSVREYIMFSKAVNALVTDSIKGSAFVNELIKFCMETGILKDLVLNHLEEVKFIMSVEERIALQREKDRYTWKQEGLMDAVKRLMSNLGVTEQKAREMLGLPASSSSVQKLSL